MSVLALDPGDHFYGGSSSTAYLNNITTDPNDRTGINGSFMSEVRAGGDSNMYIPPEDSPVNGTSKADLNAL